MVGESENHFSLTRAALEYPRCAKQIATNKMGESATIASALANGDAESLIVEAIKDFSGDNARNASCVYARVLAKAVQKQLMLDALRLSDVLLPSEMPAVGRSETAMPKIGATREKEWPSR